MSDTRLIYCLHKRSCSRLCWITFGARFVHLSLAEFLYSFFVYAVFTTQSETVQFLRGDPSSSEEAHIRIILAQTEVERVKFVVRSYIRTRLFKAGEIVTA